jgi:uncharacterized protein YndB with AHSA1/START domain
MTGKVHGFDPREGGIIRMSLTYQDPSQSPGDKTTADIDTFQARFVELVPDENIVWAAEFESDDPDFAGEKRVSFSLADAEGGTEVVVLCDNVPQGIRLEDNVAGCRSSLEKLARLLEYQCWPSSLSQ